MNQVAKTKPIRAWHFVGDTLRDESPVPKDGEMLRHDGSMIMCESGLHASKRLIDALQYAPGNTICRVSCSGDVKHGNDKFICRERVILWRVDAEQILRKFARLSALDVIHQWDAPDVVVRYLKTGDESLRSAAWYAAMSAARDAAISAAWDAARDAAMSAAWDAAWDAAWSACRTKQNRRLVAMVTAAHRKDVTQ